MESSIRFAFPDPEPLRFAGSCLHVEDVSYTYPRSKKQIFKAVNLTMELGDRVGLVGPNGHGKVRREGFLENWTKFAKDSSTDYSIRAHHWQ